MNKSKLLGDKTGSITLVDTELTRADLKSAFSNMRESLSSTILNSSDRIINSALSYVGTVDSRTRDEILPTLAHAAIALNDLNDVIKASNALKKRPKRKRKV